MNDIVLYTLLKVLFCSYMFKWLGLYWIVCDWNDIFFVYSQVREINYYFLFSFIGKKKSYMTDEDYIVSYAHIVVPMPT